MKPEIKQRIEQICRGEVPEGYKKTKTGILPEDWIVCKIDDCLKRIENPVTVQADEQYTQIGIRSHGKGLFYKEPVSGKSLGNKNVFWVIPNCFVLNIVFAWEQAIGKTTQAEEGMIGSHRFPMYYPKNNKVDIDYLISYFLTKRGTDILDAASPGGAGRNRTLGQERFMQSIIILPSLAEQQKIANILSTQDRVIELYEKKIEQLQLLKKICLKKMFPKEGSLVPEVRFPGFTAPWEQCKLGELFEFLQNNTLSRAELNNESGVAKNIHYGDILIKFGECIDISIAIIPFISSRSIADKFKNSFLKNGDIIMADTAEDETVGKCSEVFGIQNIPIISGLHTIPIRPRKEFALGYLGYYMNSVAYHDQLIPLMHGVKVTSISKGEIKNTNISYPKDKDEQARLGLFFLHIDHLITLHQRRLDEEKRKKKALMQLLLTGIVRV